MRKKIIYLFAVVLCVTLPLFPMELDNVKDRQQHCGEYVDEGQEFFKIIDQYVRVMKFKKRKRAAAFFNGVEVAMWLQQLVDNSKSILMSMNEAYNLAVYIPSDFDVAEFMCYCDIIQKMVIFEPQASATQKLIIYLKLFLSDQRNLFLYMNYKFNNDAYTSLFEDLCCKSEVWGAFLQSLISAEVLFSLCKIYHKVDGDGNRSVEVGSALEDIVGLFGRCLITFIKEQCPFEPLGSHFQPSMFLKYLCCLKDTAFSAHNMTPKNVLIYHLLAFLDENNTVFESIKSKIDSEEVSSKIHELCPDGDGWDNVFELLDDEACYQYLNALPPRTFFLVWYNEPLLLNTFLRFYQQENLDQNEALEDDDVNHPEN